MREVANQQQGLYRPEFEHDNCGIGAVVNIKGKKTHDTVANALKIVENLEHRAGKDAEGKTGDGVGILLQISHKFFKKVCKKEGFDIGGEREYGVAQLFFPQQEIKRAQAKKMFEIIVEKEGLELLGWRTVPVFPEVLGHKAKECMPCIMQAFVKKPEDVEKGLAFDRMLYIARREFEQSNDNTYVVSMNSRTIVYKGMFLVGQLRTFFGDLQSQDYESAIAVVHSRFSTNTNPSWERAHPNRFIVHNGEINTIRGNADKMLAREENMESPYLKDELHKVLPVVNRNGSDSAMLDNTLEFLVMSGMDLPLAVMITIPEPWANNDTISQEKRDFYQYYATMMEPWDGPASILFSDGDVMGAVLDRNGLRPSRYYITSDGYMILSSEVGVLPVDEEKIVLKERLHPGKMLLVDTVQGRVIDDNELKEKYAKKQPYGEWLDSNLVQLRDIKIPNQRVVEYTPEERARLQKAFGYTYEQYRTSIRNMALNGAESIGAMGHDTPLAVFSKEHYPLFDYFKQLFAQVTNPPIDAIREEIVTSTSVYVGKDGNLLIQKPENCQVLKINNPILTNTDMLKIKNMKKDGFKVVTLSTLYYKSTKLERAIDRLFVEVDKAFREGANILVLSDRGVDENHMPIPSLLAVSAVHQHLVKTKKSTSLALILESGEPREVHHFATLLGYGASAVNPYLALDTIHELIDTHMLDKDYYAAVDDYNHAVISGIVKIASKMGISTIQSYQGSQIFEAIGISQDVIDRYFTGTVSRVGGITLEDIEDNVEKLHSEAFDPLGLATDLTLDSVGAHKMRSQGEEHKYNPRTIHLLQQSTKQGSYEMFKEYTKLVDDEGHGNLRGAMGHDTPLAVFSKEHYPLFDYFKQLFAQVTNPPIDAIREEIVTSTSVYVGKDGNLLIQKPENCQVLKINNPILTNTDMLKIKNMKKDGFKVVTLSTLYYKSTKLERAIDRLFVEVDKAFREGANILVLSDRGVDENHMPIPSLLAVSAVHQHLVKTKKSTSLALILESGEPREVHHFATLLGYGASAVNPYLALDTIHELIDTHMLDKDYYAAVDDYNHAVISGIVKIASKMGISTIQSYQGSQIFEAIGISQDVIDRYFTGTVSRVGGITLEDIEDNVEKLHSEAFDPLGLATDLTLDSVGAHKMRSQGEEHKYNPRTIHLLQQSTKQGSYEMFKEYTKLVDDEGHGNLRGLLDFKFAKEPIPIDQVESVEDIVKRFKTGAMSYGSISQEAHETLAIAMNHLHGKSNTGEGGESDERLDSAGTDNDRCSAIKQVASGRFGVTSRYLVSAREIQIKMAQGAKPGEGGHLPAKKVYPWIAKTRHSTPGVSLISPPPHHDIYSIEDLAELIYDLKNANKYADISVKLVSEAGVGTVAAGVAKAGAQTVLISGYDGGTGAAPRSSIHNAGLPWELGLAETHQTLIMNGLRNRVRIETDGKLMSGRDVAIAALLGAEEFGFATAPLVTMGCVMMRVCNLDTCPVGVATQNPELRKRFRGKPEYVENFMRFIAQELREYMARLGVATIDEMVGRTDLLTVSDSVQEPHKGKVDLSAILNNPYAGKGKVTFDPKAVYNFNLEKTLDEKVLVKKCAPAIQKGEKVSVDVNVTNTDRAFGTILGSEITRNHKDGLPEDTVTVNCTGAGGQSFGAFIPKGLTLKLTGDSNDYFGKGLSGGKLIVKVPEKAGYKAEENIIVGNVALYGATSGTAFINGVAGERFAVRNSGAVAVVEGVGEHGCEYMTGGRVVVLGKTGKNFAAGMSGGIAYVLDVDNVLYKNLNKAMISIEKVENKYDKKELRDLIEAHVEATGSEIGKKVLADFDSYLPHFKKLIPDEYKRMITLSAKLEEKGLTSQQAQMEAFYESIGVKH